jgi:signal transduction histidine kinase
VRDDGAGFDVAALREQAVLGASLGLLSMEERATLAGGGLECKSAPGQGTEIHAWFPLKWRTPNP